MSELGAFIGGEIEPAMVFPLAEHLCDEMEARGWTTPDVAMRMGGTTRDEIKEDLLALNLLMAVQDDNLRVDDATLRKLAAAFDVSEQLFRNLDETWRRWPQRRSEFAPPESIYGITD